MVVRHLREDRNMKADVESQSEIIERIAQETKMPVDVVRHDYLETMQDLSDGARVRDYLTLFVARRVKAKLRDRRELA
jgi:Protein of unknown function (DUF3562)